MGKLSLDFVICTVEGNYGKGHSNNLLCFILTVKNPSSSFGVLRSKPDVYSIIWGSDLLRGGGHMVSSLCQN